MSENMKPLLGKLIITGTITVKTGLAIGGSKSGIDIGALDNPVIKYRNGDKDVPYIPGSSLKGKLRALLAKVAGSKDVDEDKTLTNEFKHLAKVFGYVPDKGETTGEALLKVRDSFLKEGNTGKTEEKMENSINRITGKANPRPLERVLPDTVFDLNLCLDVYDNDEVKEHLKLIDLAFELLNQDYLGGGGTRGNGRVQSKLSIDKYLKINSENKKIEIDNNTISFEFANGKY
jgi:CRISPR-associated protein Csm3